MTTEEHSACATRSAIPVWTYPHSGRVAARGAFCRMRRLGDRAAGPRAVALSFAQIHDGLYWLRFVLIRWLERRLPVRNLYRILKPVAFTHAVFPLFKRQPPPAPVPDCLGTGKSVCPEHANRMSWFLNRTLQYFPDELPAAKWRNCCRIVGLDHLEKARCAGHPVVLAICHFGPYYLLQCWLHAAGYPVAALVGATSKSHSRFRQLNDRISPFVENPSMFFVDQLRQVNEFLAAGKFLLITIDSDAGKQMSVPVRDGWIFQMATGAVRLAKRHQAELIPCSMIDEGGWQFRIELGQPVPREYLAAEADGISAGKHLVEEMAVHFQACPEQCSTALVQHFRMSNNGSGGKGRA